MKTLSKKEGIKTLSKIWTVFISQDENLWADPFSNRKLRHRCFFEKTNGIAERLSVYFHLGNNENPRYLSEYPDPINPAPIYFYGAFGQITVCQVRSSGTVRGMTEEEKTNFINLMKERFAGKKIGDNLPIAMKPNEIKEALQLLRSGKFYCFNPVEYSYQIYERG
jgi:hypothetical protein